MHNKVFGIIGGDKRIVYLAKSIIKDGYPLYIYGFDLLSEASGLPELPLDTLIELSDNIIFPVPVTKAGATIYAPYSSKEIRPESDFIISLSGKNVYGGLMNKLVSKNDLWSMVNYSDYYTREDFAVNNAVPTAEGAIAIAINEYEGNLTGSKCLITGYGRIGKILNKMLVSLGADVTVAARKKSDLAYARAMGAKAKPYNEIHEAYDIIFNTVPEVVIKGKLLSKQKENSLIIELATLPGGIERKTALEKGIRIIDAQSLPGKVSPKAAGEYIKEAVYNLLEE